MAVGGAATISMALRAVLVNFVDYRFIFATAAVVLFTSGTQLWRKHQERQSTVAAPTARPSVSQSASRRLTDGDDTDEHAHPAPADEGDAAPGRFADRRGAR